MNDIKRKFLEIEKCSTLQGLFSPTAKNLPAATFFTDQGFTKTTGDEGEQYYEISGDNYRLLDCPGRVSDKPGAIQLQIQFDAGCTIS